MLFNWQLTAAIRTINDTGDSGNGQWVKYLKCRRLCSGKYLDFGVRGHNNVCFTAEVRSHLDRLKRNLHLRWTDTRLPFAWEPRPLLVDFAHAYFIFSFLSVVGFIVTMACSAGYSSDLIIFFLQPASSLFAGALYSDWQLFEPIAFSELCRSAQERRGLKSCRGNVGQPANHQRSFHPVVAKLLRRTTRHDGGGGLLSDICTSAGHCKGENSCWCKLKWYNVDGNSNVLRDRLFYFRLMHWNDMETRMIYLFKMNEYIFRKRSDTAHQNCFGKMSGLLSIFRCKINLTIFSFNTCSCFLLCTASSNYCTLII